MTAPRHVTGGFVVLGLCAALPAASAEIEEIVVTATKRETQLQETPIAITAFGSQQIERDQIEDFRDIAIRTPGLVFAQTNSMSLITLRGVGLDITNLAGETAIAVYKDGIYQGQTFSLSMPSFDLERIEVLRGPQGTLYGRNATGGAVNVISKRPSEETEWNGAVTLGDYDRYKVELGLTDALTDNFSFRASGVLDRREEGYRDNVVTGKDEDDDDARYGRLATLWAPSEALDVELAFSYHDQTRTGTELQSLELAPNPLGITPANVGGFLTFPDPGLGGASLADVFGLTFPVAQHPTADPDDLEYHGEAGTEQDFTVWDAAASVTWQVDGMTLKSITAWRDSKWDRFSDNDGTDIPMLTQWGLQEGEQFTQELNLSGGSERLDWLVGAYYFSEDADAQFLYDLTALQTTFEAVFGLLSPLGAPLPPGSLAAAGLSPLGRHLGRLAGTPTPATPFLDFLMEQESKSYAVFGEVTYHVSDRLDLTGGVRYTSDEKDVTRSLTSNIADPAGLCVDKQDDQDWDETTGQAIVSYRLSEANNVYGKVSRGYKAGGFNPGECAENFDPETLWAYEIGSKNAFFDRQMQLNAAAFYYDYEDIQVNRFVENASSVQNAAQAEILGAELEFIAIPGALPDLQLSGSVTWLDTEYSEGAFSDPIAGGALIDVSGNRMMRAPEWKFTLAAQYSIATDVGTFTLAGDTSYTDSYYFDVFEASLPNQSETEQDGYGITNLRLVWTSTDERLEAQAFVENVTDEIYSETRVPVGTTGSVMGEFSAPRVWGVRFSTRL